MDRNRATEPRNRIIRHAPMPLDANQFGASRPTSGEKQNTNIIEESESVKNDDVETGDSYS